MKKVDVIFRGWGQDWVLGTLADNGSHVLFEYSAEALQRGIEFSRHKLPLRREAYSGFPACLERLPGLISDALPDGWGLLLMDKVFLSSGRDPTRVSPLERLSFIGNRAMGALAFRPAEKLELDDGDMSLLELAQATHDVIEDKDVEALKALALVGGSPQGARPKALVRFEPSTRVVSTRDTAPGTPWLVKFPERAEHPEVCAIEHAYATLARASGIEMPPTALFRINAGLAAFGVERFDRVDALRVPVHSFAGALHADFRQPSMDYRTVLRLTRLMTADEQEVRKAFLRCVFNVVLHNRDDHSKNFAFRMNERMEWKLAPAYDLTFSMGLRGHHQTSIMGESLAPARGHLIALAKDCGIPAQLAVDSIDLVRSVAADLASVVEEAGVRKRTVKAIAKLVEQNSARCAAS